MVVRSSAPRLLPSAILVVAAVVATPGAARPVRGWTDTAVVESTIQEVYARPPADMLFAASNNEYASAQQAGRQRHAKGGGNKNGKGYHHKHSSSGNDGYKQFDAFHTKSGDKYGYQQHSSFGKKKQGGKNEKYGAAHDAGFAGSHPDVEVVKDVSRMRQGPRSQSLQDASGDASVDHENTKYRRGLHEDDMFFVFSGNDAAADGNEQQDDGEAQQQQAADDDDHDDDGEAAEQQEAADDDDDDESGQQRKQQEAEDDYDY